MNRVLLFSATTGYQLQSFREAGEGLGLDLLLATDRCHVLDDPWGDAAIPVRFHAEGWSLKAILEATAGRRVDGVLALGDRPAVLAAAAGRALGLPGHPADAVRRARNKRSAREAFAAAGLPTPWVKPVDWATLDLNELVAEVSYPAVVKPLALSGSRGVMRADDPAALRAAVERLHRLLHRKEVLAERDESNKAFLIEGYIDGAEYAVEGLLDRGRLQTLAIFDKPDPLCGPFFEETIYVTPTEGGAAIAAAIEEAVARGVRALGLWHGPVHAECRLNPAGVWLLEIAARPIGGLCARSLRFERGGETVSLEGLLLKHAAGEDVRDFVRERSAAGVMMIPIPNGGYLKGVEGVEQARAVAGIDDLQITAKPDQLLLPLPEGASYLGFIFARAETGGKVVAALRAAHAVLRFRIDAELPVNVAAAGE
jgi:hypothetical protein